MVSLYISIVANGRGFVRNPQWCAGMGGWMKRRPSCNEVDRGSAFAPGENRADFHLVLCCKKIVIRLFI
ncbi:hypothetical protein QA597_06230 [Marinilabiliaceae bacterium ANBcel2]|nr:hypothetical protein [Marinilabiliaceae bacterium ANBcel2]